MPTIIQPKTSQPQRKQKLRKTRRKDIKLPQISVPTKVIADEAVYEEMYNSVERAATTATGLDAEQDRSIISKTQFTATLNEPSSIWTSSVVDPGVKRPRGMLLLRLEEDGLKRLYKASLSARVESSAEEQSLVDETAKDQGRCDDQEMFDTSVLDDKEEVLLKEAQYVQNVVEKVIEDITTARIEETVSTGALITTVDVTPDELTMAQALAKI
nr:hypothetical protein [Tanacetum cinerariifolium]